MRFGWRFKVMTLVLSLTGSTVLSRTDTLGVVTQARSASLSSGPVSVGTSVYDGDRLSTETDGALTLRAGASMLYLGRQSQVTLRSCVGEVRAAQVSLGAGTVVFSTLQAAPMEVLVDEARIRAASGAPTLAQVTMSGPKALFVYARRGPLQISYHDESETIAEGDSYRVLLDPPSDDSSTKTVAAQPGADKGRKRKRLLLLLISVAAVGGAVAAVSTTWAAFKDYESPAGP